MCTLLVPQTAAAAWRALFSVLGLPFLSFRPEPFSAVSIIVYIVALFLFVCYVVSCTSSGRTRCFLFFTAVLCVFFVFFCFSIVQPMQCQNASVGPVVSRTMSWHCSGHSDYCIAMSVGYRTKRFVRCCGSLTIR